MATWCPSHNLQLWRELGNTTALGYASNVAIDRLRADPHFAAALAKSPRGNRETAYKVIHAHSPICCYLSKEHPAFMTEIIEEARRLAAAAGPTKKPV
jgi:hypothetical protein